MVRIGVFRRVFADLRWPCAHSYPPWPLDSCQFPACTRERRIIKEMSPQISIDRDAVSAFCQRHHIKRLALFGSVLRDDFRPDSDIDVIVEFQPGHVPGLDFVAIEREFSRLLEGRRVDMVTPKSLNARIRDQVLCNAESLYVAA